MADRTGCKKGSGGVGGWGSGGGGAVPEVVWLTELAVRREVEGLGVGGRGGGVGGGRAVPEVVWLTELAVRREVEGWGVGGRGGWGGRAVPEVVWLTELLPSPLALQLLAHPLLRVALLRLRQVLQVAPDEGAAPWPSGRCPRSAATSCRSL